MTNLVAFAAALRAEHAAVEDEGGPRCKRCVTWLDDEGATEFGIAVPEPWPCKTLRQLDGMLAAGLCVDGPWWLLISFGRPFSGFEMLGDGKIRVPFSDKASASSAAGELSTSVVRVPALIQGETVPLRPSKS